MKTCPTCLKNYEDNTLKFCLDDGSLLVGETASGMTSSADPTLVLPGHSTEQPPTVPSPQRSTNPQQSTITAVGQTPPAPVGSLGSNIAYASDRRRRSHALVWIVAALIIGGSAIAVALIVMRGRQREPSAASQLAPSTQNQGEAGSTSSPAAATTDKPASTNNALPVAQPSARKGQATAASNSTVTSKPSPASTPTPVEKTTPHAPISGGVLNGRAIRLPPPSYPSIAKAAHASGTVVVQVLIDEDGNVISAHAVSGHPLLQQSAVSAARQAKFSPTKLSGQPVKVSGVITYNFQAQ